jgi:very-short-patch-repair endonuclease
MQDHSTIVCAQCNTPFHLALYRQIRCKNHFCSQNCRTTWNETQGKSPQLFKCEQCEKEFIGHASANPRFCSKECKCIASRRMDVRNCEYCKKEFTCFPSQTNRFCSRHCSRMAQFIEQGPVKYPTKLCENCGIEFEIRIKAKAGRFCSRPCFLEGVSKDTVITKICEYCEKPFTCRSNERERKYCSMSCGARKNTSGAYDPTWEPRVTVQCEICGKTKEIAHHKVKRFRFCSAQCRSAFVVRNAPRISSIEYKMADAFNQIGLFPVAQHIIPPYSIDLAFIDQKIAVECDGDYWHNRESQKKSDKRKDAILASQGWKVLRLWEHEINSSPMDCAKRVAAYLQGFTS